MSNTYQIYLISDSTGETIDRIFLALKAQFKNIEYKVHSYSFTRTENQILKILEDAKKNENKWEVFFSERGNKNDLKIFETEQKACEYFFNYITGFDFIMNDLKPKEEPKKKGLLGRLGF